MAQRDIYDSISPIDYRYWDEEAAAFLSENAFTRYKCRVEAALAKALHKHGLCDARAAEAIGTACLHVLTEEVYDEEKRIGHDMRALVNCIQKLTVDDAKRFVHMTATSFDISDTANAARYKDCVEQVVVPRLIFLNAALANLARREAATPQIGRTHGQHAVPITFGFAIAEYVSRLRSCIENLSRLASQLPGKFSGGVGAYNASSLFIEDPEMFEGDILAELGLQPADHSTQVVQPEPLARLIYECALAAGIMANLADDMRHLQRTEIGEVGEAFALDQVGSSTMPQKRNPINFENVKSIWKVIMPRVMTVLMDQISEHQRDLTNSASARTYGEVLCYVVATAKRLTRTMNKLEVDRENCARDLAMQGDLIAAEPLYIILAALGHPNAHEAVREATLRAQTNGSTLLQAAQADSSIEPYLQRISPKQMEILANPVSYTGIAERKALSISSTFAG